MWSAELHQVQPQNHSFVTFLPQTTVTWCTRAKHWRLDFTVSTCLLLWSLTRALTCLNHVHLPCTVPMTGGGVDDCIKRGLWDNYRVTCVSVFFFWWICCHTGPQGNSDDKHFDSDWKFFHHKLCNLLKRTAFFSDLLFLENFTSRQ